MLDPFSVGGEEGFIVVYGVTLSEVYECPRWCHVSHTWSQHHCSCHTKSSSVQQVSASVYSISKSGVTRHQLIAGGWAECSRQVCPGTAVVTLCSHGKACTRRSQVITKWKLSRAVSSPRENFANTFFCYQKPHFIAIVPISQIQVLIKVSRNQ